MAEYQLYELSKKEIRTFYLCCTSGLFLLGIIFFRSLFAGLLLTLLSKKLWPYYVKHLLHKRKQELNKQFKDLLFSLSASIAAGHSMRKAIVDAYEDMNLIYGTEAMLSRELQLMKQKMEWSNQSEDQVLQDFAFRSELEDIENFVDIYCICRETGGDLSHVIQKASQIITDKINISLEIAVLTSQKRLEVKILALIPIIIIVALQFLSMEYIEVLYTTMAGKGVMAGALTGIVFSYLASMRMIQVDL